MKQDTVASRNEFSYAEYLGKKAVKIILISNFRLNISIVAHVLRLYF